MSVLRAVIWAAAGAIAVSGGEALRRRSRARAGDYRVFVLEYHDVSPDAEEREGVVGVERLRRHLRFLKRRFHLVSLSQAVAALARSEPLHEDLVVVTFDDGYAGNYEFAWPALRAEGVPATVFVTTSFLDGEELWFDLADRCFDAATSAAAVGDPDLRAAMQRWTRPGQRAHVRAWMKGLPDARRRELLAMLRASCPPRRAPARALGWDQVRELAAAGVEIGCHTVSHPILARLPPAGQRDEIVRARDRIAAEVGRAPGLFAYPNGALGDFTAETITLLHDAGFTAACTTIRGSNRPGCDLMQLARIGVGAEPCAVLAARMTGMLDDSVRTRFRSWRVDAPAS